MPDLGILGWIIIGLLAGALAGFFVPGRERMGCIGTMLVGIAGGQRGHRVLQAAGSHRQSMRCAISGAITAACASASSAVSPSTVT